MQKKTGKYFDYRDISIKFTRNLPVDLATTAQIITQLKGVISKDGEKPIIDYTDYKSQAESRGIDGLYEQCK